MKPDDYVKYCLNSTKPCIISQFRVGILPFHIETGRFRNVKGDERKCHLCYYNDHHCINLQYCNYLLPFDTDLQ